MLPSSPVTNRSFVRVGVVVRHGHIARWVRILIDRLVSTDNIEVVCLQVAAGTQETFPAIDASDWSDSSRSPGWRLVRRFELFRYAKIVAHSYGEATLPVDVTIVDVPTTAGRVLLGPPVGALGLDAVVLLAGIDDAKDASAVTRLGLWRLSMSPDSTTSRTLPGYWEVIEGRGTTAVAVEALLPHRDGWCEVARASATSDRHSVLANRAHGYATGSQLLQRVLLQHARHGATQELTSTPMASGRLERHGMPSTIEAALGILRTVARLVLDKVRERHTRDQWILLYSLASSGRPDFAFERFTRIVPPPDRFWADPFVVAQGDRWLVFFEELVYSERDGVLAVLEIFPDGTWGNARRILECPYHLSYPFVFSHDEHWYLIPETHAARRIELYRAVAFPDRWEKVRDLVDDVDAVDATLVARHDRWWMFVNIRESTETTHHESLNVYVTDDPIHGTWQAHQNNPVIVDVTSARPGGRFLDIDGELIRPSQDSSYHYGYGLKLNRVARLDEQAYQEDCMTHFVSSWANDLVGVHTIAHAGNLTVIDALRRHRK